MKSGVLLLDLGNSYLKHAFYDEKQLRGPVQSVPLDSLDVVSLLNGLAQEQNIASIRLANVAGLQQQQRISDWCQQHDVILHVAEVQSPRGDLIVGYTQPRQLGIDRWLILLALRQRSKNALLAVSCGTAVTLDRLEADGLHSGGLIIPGLDLMLNALQKHTANICIDRNSVQDTIELGTDTGGCVISGALHAITGMIEKQYRRSIEQLAITPEVFLTGGNASLVARHLSLPARVVPDLVLQGLAVLQQMDFPQ
ncbi:MAG: type III pantothenate kinase [Chromatiales bacterium]|jgi:type III pantothenate kinase